MIKPRLSKRKTKYTICEEARFALTLSYLSQAVSSSFLGWSFKMGKTIVLSIIYETCDILWDQLASIYCRIPDQTTYKKIAGEFETRWNLPNCTGAIDGRHMSIIAPPHSGSKLYNYKNFYSIVMLAACDANYVFTMVDVGAYGSQTDGGILSESPFGKKFYNNNLSLPPQKNLPLSPIIFPHFFIGDPAFLLRPNLMRPYSGKCLPLDQKIFNYRISRGRVVIENSFGILVARWGILQTTLKCIPLNAERIVLACVALHNYIMISKTSMAEPSYIDTEDDVETITPGQWRSEVVETTGLRQLNQQVGSNNASRFSFNLRNKLKEYFLNEGAILRQLKIK